LADAKLLYANLLRLVWRKRRRRRDRERERENKDGRKSSVRSEPTIQEEEEEDVWTIEGSKKEDSNGVEQVPELGYRGSTGEQVSEIDRRESAGPKSHSRKGSALDAIPDGAELSSFSRSEPRYGSGGSISIPQSGRRGSWLPNNGDALVGRNRRLSSMTAPLVGPDGISAWNRKASVIALEGQDESESVSSTELSGSAWQLLEGAIKQYKLALSLLSTSDLPIAQLACAKTDTLTNISYASLFMASLAPRLAIAMINVSPSS